jgi:putative ABC transport system ATP-binding protein
MIVVKDISKDYTLGEETVHALKHVSFQVNSGDFIAIMGPSGSGKSTLMNILGCLTIPDCGEYYIDDINIIDSRDDKLADIRSSKVGFIFQNFNLIPKLNAYENVELPLIYRGFRKKDRHSKVINALKMVGLDDRMYHKPNEMSGGQQQRTAIARAFVGEPEIILADEPTGNLDSKAGKEIMEILLELNNRGKTIILITHDINVAENAKRIMRIVDGELTEDLSYLASRLIR